jgi:predicted transcriptional regulator
MDPLPLDTVRHVLEGFGLHLARTRKAVGISTRALASVVGVRHDIITRIEKGCWVPSPMEEQRLRQWMVHHSEWVERPVS